MLLAKLFLNYFYYIYKLFPFTTYIFTFCIYFQFARLGINAMPHANKTKIQTLSAFNFMCHLVIEFFPYYLFLFSKLKIKTYCI